MARYNKKSGEEVKKAVHKQKRGQLKSGRSGKKGAKAPKKKSSGKSS
jgi:hypothetical protein